MIQPLLEVKQVCLLGGPPNDLSIASGEWVGLEGPSGAGKSVFFQAVSDLVPHQGGAWLAGQSRAAMTASLWRSKVAYLTAESAWWADQLSDHFKDPDSLPCAELLLDPKLLDGPVARLSTGERQRLALLRMMENRPQVLLLDEPTASLDPASRDATEKFLIDYVRQTGAAAILTSHDPQQIKRLTTRRYQVKDLAITEVV